jgi:glutamate-ammonia-ligase adenylyltransferase
MPDLIRKIDFSRYALQRLAALPELGREVDLAGAASAPFSAREMAAALQGSDSDDEQTFKRRLRRLRQRVLLRTLARDLENKADLSEVCETFSELADLCIRAALARVGEPELIVVAMGKLGGRELNVSSDVDLVFVHPQGEDRPRLERAGRRLIALLGEVTEDGFVFRVDMRLRPYGDSGPLVCSFDALEQYFVAQGREWERYAWIKARPISVTPEGVGGSSHHAALDAIVRPFVFRKYLDYATLSAMRRLHAEVRRDVARRELADHVKLGPGGIREIEFIAQALQLIRGGRDPELTARPTLQVLDLLSSKKVLPEPAKEELASAYLFLRRVEHRLQYLDDAQRHDLPEDAEDQVRLARMMDCGSWAEFRAALQLHRDAVSRHFQSVFAEPGAGAAEDWPAHPRLEALRASQRYAQLPEQSRERVDRLVPALARAAKATPDPDATLARGVDLIEAVARRAAYLALLAERPEALERVTRMIGASSWAAEYVTRHPLLLDELLDDRLLYAAPDWMQIEQGMRGAMAAAGGDVERQMNVVREQHQAQQFRLLAQDLAGLLTVEKLADHLSLLADLALQVSLEAVWAQLPSRHAEQPRFAVIGYGKLGGKELGYASDLDIIFLFDDAHDSAEQNYIRLAQRYNNWLSANTTAGPLFETDLALRPSGSKGLMVSSLSGFEQYQEHSAWVWEHQALTRARFCAGDPRIGSEFERIREKILRRRRDPAALARDVLGMRERIHAAHPNRSGLFDLKHDRGGMIDIEFCVQYLVLAHAHSHPRLTANLGNIALLMIAAELGLIEKETAERNQAAYRDYRRLQHALRLNGAQYARVPPERAREHAEAVRALWAATFPG